MGCKCSKSSDGDALPNPLQQLRLAEAAPPRVQRRQRQEEKRQRQLAKLQKRNARKRRQRRGSGKQTERANSLRRSRRQSSRGSHNLAPQLRLLGGSNGSSATECVSALYARTLEQQREEHQRIIEQKTRHQLERQLHTFLLNQLLLGIQFFGHFEHELAAIDDQLLAKQRASAQILTEHSLLHASAIDAAVAKRLLFKSTDDSRNAQAEPLQRPLTYVVFENVDVARPNDANYDSIAALCKVLLETDYYQTTPCRTQYVKLLEQSRWLGYVRLKLREPTPAQRTSSSSPNSSDDDDNDAIDAIYTDGSSGYSTGAYGGGQSWTEGDYDYVYIARLNTQRPLEELKLLRSSLQPNVLPEACVCRLSSCLPAWLEQSDDDDDAESSEEEQEEEEEEEEEHLSECRSGYETVQVLRQCRVEQQRRRAQLQQCYLSSQQFMNYFGELLRQQLASQLGIGQTQLSAASYRGCSVYTQAEELVPAIHVPHTWPDCAFEFNLRSRPQLTNLHTGEQFQWPTPAMRQRIQSFGYHVVPVGYAPKRARNPFRELEWRIVFPQAEQFLERHLTRMQLKVLLVMKALVRSHVNDKCQAMGHIMEQLRTHLFWLCERHSNDWPEEFLGEQLVRFVRTFADCLARKQLNDYFIERRNLFEHVPEEALMELHAIMAAIAEQPLIHVLQALRNLQHSDHFYPRLDYNRLLETLLADDYLQLRNGAKFARKLPTLSVAGVEEQREQPSSKLPVASDAQGLLGMRLHQERTRGKLRRKTQMLRAQQLKLAEQRRLSTDASPLTLTTTTAAAAAAAIAAAASAAATTTTTAPLNDGLEILRRTNLLELLLDHMLAMLAKATEYRNGEHARLYLEQAQRLCRLYQQLGCSQYAQHYAEALCQAASEMERMHLAAASPRTSCSSSSRHTPVVEHAVHVEHMVQVHPLAAAGDDSGAEFVEPQPKLEPQPEAEPQTEPQPEPEPMLDALLQRLQLDTISAKTEQLMQTLAPESRRRELRNLLKRNTQKVKSAFD